MSKNTEFEYELNIVTVGGVDYEINRDGTAVVCEQNGDDLDKLVRIESEIRDDEGRICRVTKIRDEAFASQNILEVVEIGDGIREIGEWAFSGCDNLKTVKLPSGIKELKKSTFYDCFNLQSIVIPDCVTCIGDSAFSGCKALSDLILPENLTYIGSNAFDNCVNLKSMYISKYVTYIGDRAFDHCGALEQIEVDPDNSFYFGDGIRLIEKHTNKVLYKCKSKNSTNSKTSSKNSDKEERKKSFAEGKKVKDMLIKDGFNYFLGHDYTAAVAECYNHNISRLVIPTEVDDGDGATYRITELYGTLFFCEKELEEVYIPEGIEVIGENAFAECVNLKKVNLPTTLRSLGARTFSGCEKLAEINMNNMVKKIEKDTFFGCDSFESFVFPDCLEEIDERAFGMCKNLSTLTFPSSLKKIGEESFCHCDKLKSVYIPSSVEEISGDAFDGCSSFERIEVNAENPIFYSDGNCVIERSTGILTVGCKQSVIPEGVREIAEKAFYGRNQFSRIDLPFGIVKIGDKAFANCFGLLEIYIPESVKEIGDGAFEKCIGVNLRCQTREIPDGWSKYMGVKSDRIGLGCVRRPPKPQKVGFIKRIIRFFTGKN